MSSIHDEMRVWRKHLRNCALETKKTAWAAKELDATDLTSYDAMPTASESKPAGW